jgi:hypothetical protein
VLWARDKAAPTSIKAIRCLVPALGHLAPGVAKMGGTRQFVRHQARFPAFKHESGLSFGEHRSTKGKNSECHHLAAKMEGYFPFHLDPSLP